MKELYYKLVGTEVIEISFTEYVSSYPFKSNRVKYSKNKDIAISTIFLGNSYYSYSSYPLLFETMILGGECDGVIYRYATYTEALCHHNLLYEQLCI